MARRRPYADVTLVEDAETITLRWSSRYNPKRKYLFVIRKRDPEQPSRERVTSDCDTPGGIMSDDRPLWQCPRCGACIGYLMRFFQLLGWNLHECPTPPSETSP